jgi:hypothetical protein
VITSCSNNPNQALLVLLHPMIGAWLGEQEAPGFFEGAKPEASTHTFQYLFDDGIRHERVSLDMLEGKGARIARLLGRQSDVDYATKKEAMAEDFGSSTKTRSVTRRCAALPTCCDSSRSHRIWAYAALTSLLLVALKICEASSFSPMDDLSNSELRQVYMDHCARLMSMQKLFRFNREAAQVEQLVFDACFELRKLLEPHMTPEESDELGLRLLYAQP